MISRAGIDSVALETTLLVHGLPPGMGDGLARELCCIVRDRGVRPALVGVIRGRAVVGLTEEELGLLLQSGVKANTSNLGSILFSGASAATTVSTTLELAAAAGVRVFATGGLGGIHKGYGEHLDISSDLLALTRFPLAVVASGVKSILDVAATREALETLGIPVAGFSTDTFPAFYLRETDLGIDARFDDIDELASFLRFELERSGRAVVVANPVPVAEAIGPDEFAAWLAEAQERVQAARPGLGGRRGQAGRDVTPALLAALHEVSRGATLRANLALVRSNTDLAARLCRAMLDQS
jgi:pseudouridylate synthase